MMFIKADTNFVRRGVKSGITASEQLTSISPAYRFVTTFDMVVERESVEIAGGERCKN